MSAALLPRPSWYKLEVDAFTGEITTIPHHLDRPWMFFPVSSDHWAFSLGGHWGFSRNSSGHWVFSRHSSGPVLNDEQQASMPPGMQMLAYLANNSHAHPLAQGNLQNGPSYSYPERLYVQAAEAARLPIVNPSGPVRQGNIPSQVPEEANRENKKVSGAEVTARGALHTSTNGTATDNSRVGHPLEASHAHSTGSCTSDATIVGKNKPEAGTQSSGTLAQFEVPPTRECTPVAAKPVSRASRRSPTPSSRPHKRVKLASEADLGEEETAFILYLSLQNIRRHAIAIELSRMTQQFNNLPQNLDRRTGLLGRQVVNWLKSFQQSKKTEEEAEKIVADLLAQGEDRGWCTGPLSRARDYSKSLAGGEVLSENRKSRQEEARCRQALKKWRLDHPGVLPCPGMRTVFERRAYDGMMMEAAQNNLAGPDKELMKRNLLEFWEHGTIGGKAIE